LKSLIEDGCLFSICRDVIDSGWAINAANAAIIKLLAIEKRDTLPNDNPIAILEEKWHENQSEYVSDSLQDDARSYSEDPMESGDDVEGITASEAAVNAETTEFSPLGRLLDLLDEDDGSAYSSAMNSTDNSVEIEDIVSKKVANAAYKGFQIIEKADLPATLSVDIDGEYSKVSKVRVFIEEGTSRQVHVAAQSVTNELEDGGHLGFSGTEVAPAENSVKLQGEDEKNGVNLSASVLMIDCDNNHIAAVNSLFKHEDIDIKEMNT
jgi:hypothetical protein